MASTQFIFEHDLKVGPYQVESIMATQTNALYVCLSKGYDTLEGYEYEIIKDGKVFSIHPNGEPNGFNTPDDGQEGCNRKLIQVSCSIGFKYKDDSMMKCSTIPDFMQPHKAILKELEKEDGK